MAIFVEVKEALENLRGNVGDHWLRKRTRELQQTVKGSAIHQFLHEGGKQGI